MSFLAPIDLNDPVKAWAKRTFGRRGGADRPDGRKTTGGSGGLPRLIGAFFLGVLVVLGLLTVVPALPQLKTPPTTDPDVRQLEKKLNDIETSIQEWRNDQEDDQKFERLQREFEKLQALLSQRASTDAEKRELEARLREVQGALDRAQQDLAKEATQRQELEVELAGAVANGKGLVARLEDANRYVSDLRATAAGLEAEKRAVEDRIQLFQGELQQAREDLTKASADLRTRDAELAQARADNEGEAQKRKAALRSAWDLRIEKARLEVEQQALETRLLEAREDLQQVSESLAKATSELQQKSIELSQALAQSSTEIERREAATQAISELRADKARLEAGKRGVEAQLQQLQESLRRAREDLVKATLDVEKRDKELARANGDKQLESAKREAVSQDAQALRVEKARVEADKRAVEELLQGVQVRLQRNQEELTRATAELQGKEAELERALAERDSHVAKFDVVQRAARQLRLKSVFLDANKRGFEARLFRTESQLQDTHRQLVLALGARDAEAKSREDAIREAAGLRARTARLEGENSAFESLLFDLGGNLVIHGNELTRATAELQKTAELLKARDLAALVPAAECRDVGPGGPVANEHAATEGASGDASPGPLSVLERVLRRLGVRTRGSLVALEGESPSDEPTPSAEVHREP